MTAAVEDLPAAAATPARKGFMAAIIAVGLTPTVMWTGI
jgi:hypothetical protein